jgi:non-homologous end joining protein Ku
MRLRTRLSWEQFRFLNFDVRDEHAERILKLIEKERSKHEAIVETETQRQKPAKVVDLMEVLKRSLTPGRKTKQADKFRLPEYSPDGLVLKKNYSDS